MAAISSLAETTFKASRGANTASTLVHRAAPELCWSRALSL